MLPIIKRRYQVIIQSLSAFRIMDSWYCWWQPCMRMVIRSRNAYRIQGMWWPIIIFTTWSRMFLFIWLTNNNFRLLIGANQCSNSLASIILSAISSSLIHIFLIYLIFILALIGIMRSLSWEGSLKASDVNVPRTTRPNRVCYWIWITAKIAWNAMVVNWCIIIRMSILR